MGLKVKEETDLKNRNDFVDLFNEIPGFHDCNYDDAVDWLASDRNDLKYLILNSDEIIYSLENHNGHEERDDSSIDRIICTLKGPSSAKVLAAF